MSFNNAQAAPDGPSPFEARTSSRERLRVTDQIFPFSRG